MKTLKEKILHEEKYIDFLQKKVDSKNFKANVSDEEFLKTKEKLKKSKLILTILKK